MDKLWKWDGDGEGLERSLTKDEPLTGVMIYWVTDMMPAAARIYHESRRDLRSPSSITLFQSTGTVAPLRIVLFPKEIDLTPRVVGTAEHRLSDDPLDGDVSRWVLCRIGGP